LKVLIADDHGLYRAGLCFLLKDRLGAGPVIEVASLDEALDVLARDHQINLALFDLSMPGMVGPESLGAVKAAYPQIHVAVISGAEDRDLVLRSIATGLSGYVPKSLSDDDIAKALEMMLNGYIFVPPFMNSAVKVRPPSSDAPEAGYAARDGRARIEELTPRQRDVLHHILQGRSNKEIARELEIAEGTVKIHLAALFGHFSAHNRTELATRAHGLLTGSVHSSQRSE
jgi:DNA-binding NarL/FixJ family response regulator